MSVQQRGCWRALIAVLAVAILYALGVAYLGAVDLGGVDRSDWRGFVRVVLIFAVVVHVVLFAWVDRDGAPASSVAVAAQSSGDRWGFSLLACGLASCVLLLPNPTFSPLVGRGIYHILVGLLLAGFAVKYAREIVVLRRAGA